LKQPKPYLESAISGINAIDSYRPKNEVAFMSDSKSQDAILMRLQDIGENLSKVRDGFPDFWDENSSSPWDKAIGLRNIISHGYGEISLAVIWTLITEDLDSLRKSIESVL
jgi:uncharacterized protein with HEPN domain